MAPKKKSGPEERSIDVIEVTRGVARFAIIGESPLVLNRMSEKAKRQLLMPTKKTRSERQSTLKHDPLEEYRASPHTIADESAPTYLAMPAAAFGKAMASAALRMPGATKTEIGQLVRADGQLVGVYGVPQLSMAVVRSADMNKTPDIRSRAIVPQWACLVSVTFVTPLIREATVVSLLAGAGMMVGIGDGRQEKGSGLGWGAFRLTNTNDLDFRRIVANGGRAAQIAAIERPAFYDDETERLFAFYLEEKERLGFTDKKTTKKAASA